MTVSVRVRFEVFKRDRFTCAYCGKTPPDVLLECDHIIPRAAGGTDDITNLTTACRECNAGKSDRLLEEGTAPVLNRAVVEDLRERLEQAAAYTELVGQQTALIDKQVALVQQAWAVAFRAAIVERDDGAHYQFEYGQFLNERSIRQFIRKIPIAELLAAIDITSSRFDIPYDSACRFFYKICWRRMKGEGGPIGDPKPAVASARSPELLDSYEQELEAAYGRIDDLEAEVRDLRAIVTSYQDETRSRKMTGPGGQEI